jgi:hypothetical protein
MSKIYFFTQVCSWWLLNLRHSDLSPNQILKSWFKGVLFITVKLKGKKHFYVVMIFLCSVIHKYCLKKSCTPLDSLLPYIIPRLSLQQFLCLSNHTVSYVRYVYIAECRNLKVQSNKLLGRSLLIWCSYQISWRWISWFRTLNVKHTQSVLW